MATADFIFRRNAAKTQWVHDHRQVGKRKNKISVIDAAITSILLSAKNTVCVIAIFKYAYIMFRPHFTNAISHTITVGKNSARCISLLKIKERFKHILGMDSDKIPYQHVCQIGDPVLRSRAMKIEPEVIKLPDFQKVIEHLISVMRRYDACGLSAPQIGLPWQMFVAEYTKEHMKSSDKVIQKVHEMKTLPLTIFINPELKVIDHTPIVFYEGCESIRGFSASVPRAYEVEITALNALAEQFTWRARGWSARIVQHEYDHLQGKLYTDKMDISTFNCTAWARINENGGNIRLSYMPK